MNKEDVFCSKKYQKTEMIFYKKLFISFFPIKKCKFSFQYSKYYDLIPKFEWTKYFDFYLCNECWLKFFFIYNFWRITNASKKIADFFQSNLYMNFFQKIFNIEFFQKKLSLKNLEKIVKKILLYFENLLNKLKQFASKISKKRWQEILLPNFFVILEINLQRDILKYFSKTNTFLEFLSEFKNFDESTILEISKIISKTNLTL